MRDNTDRPGFDLRPPFLLMAPDPMLCRNACFAEFGCRAWVYARPGTRHPSRATCTLKSIPGPRVETPCCITGGRSSLF
jgi:PAN domain